MILRIMKEYWKQLVKKKGNSLKEMSGENKVEVRLRPADNNWTGGDLGAGGAIAEHSVSTLSASKFIWSFAFYLVFCVLRLCWIFYLFAFQPYHADILIWLFYFDITTSTLSFNLLFSKTYFSFLFLSFFLELNVFSSIAKKWVSYLNQYHQGWR